MSLLQQIVDSIGDSIGGYDQQATTSTVPAKPRTPEKENRDHASPPELVEEKKDCSSSTQEAKDTMIEITNLAQAVQQDRHHDSASQGHPSRKHSMDTDSASASSVSFGSVQVREYERVIDSTKIYMGLALGWNYNDKGPAPIREKNKTSKYSAASSHGGESRMKRTNGSDRYGMLIKYGYANKELKQANKEAAQFYKQRQREAARSIVVADERNKSGPSDKPKRRPLLRSMFG